MGVFPEKKEKEHNASLIRMERNTGILMAFLFVLFLMSIVFYIWFTTGKNITERSDMAHANEIEVMYFEIMDNMSRLEAHIVHISNTSSICKFLETGLPIYKEETEEFFRLIMEYNTRETLPTFDQIRVLDMDGMEKARVNLGRDNKAVVVDDKDLQDKSDRYYYRESLDLGSSDIYISPLDLNVEQGTVERPFKPVIRVSKLIYNSSEEPLGMLVLNQKFDSVFRNVESKKRIEGDIWFLLNGEGYYLYHPDRDRTYGFMFENKQGSGFFSDYENIWNEARSNGQSFLECDDGKFYFFSFSPDEGGVFRPTEPMKWYLATFVPRQLIRKERFLLDRAIIISLILIIPFFVVTGLILGRSIVRNRWYVKELEKSAVYDKMTGLFNRQAIMERLGYLIDMTERHDEPLCAAFIDLDDLKIINDTKGHEQGDILIGSMGRSIKSILRKTDLPARIGGDEFLILFPGLSDENASEVMTRISREFARTGKKLFGEPTGFSWGISQWKGKEDKVEDFIARADKAMYQMKRDSKGR